MKKRFKVVLLVAFLLIGLFYLIDLGYQQDWTGFREDRNAKGEVIPTKKLWDWMSLLIVPIFLAVGGWWLNKSQKESDQRRDKSQKESDQKIETDRQQQKSLEDYFNCMTDLLLKNDLLDRSKNHEARSIARTRTLVLLRMLDGGRKGQAIQFLHESGLITKNPIVSLIGADLTNAGLSGATLGGAEIRGANLRNADLKGAQLGEADLRGSDFTQADLSDAMLVQANLRQAMFTKAKLHNADLTDADTAMVDFSDSDLKGAKLPPPK